MTTPTWIGKTLANRYKIEQLLGQGGMSAVYKAMDPNLGRVVAIKLIHPHLSADPEFVRRFEEEARAVAQLRHPNIIQVYDFNHDGDSYFIVFEFVPGETLQARLKRLHENGSRLDLATTVNIGTQIAEALDYAHSRGLVHRDIKPANVMLNVHNEPILMDFGIVKIVGGTQHTATGAVMGTARYMSPEQIKGERIDERTDVYSLGIMLFEMASGRAPFEADSAMTVMMMHVNDPVPDVTALRPDVYPALKNIINKALAKDRGNRFRTAGDMAQALRAVGAAASEERATIVEAPVTDPKQTVVEPVTAPPVARTPTPSTRSAATGATSPPASARPAASPPPPANRRRMVALGVGALLVVLLLACIAGAGLLLSNGAFGLGGGDGTPVAAATTPEAADGDIDVVGVNSAEEPAAELNGGPPTSTPQATRTPTATTRPSATPQPDQDEDGVPDATDACPAEPAGLYPAAGSPGCPAPPTATPSPTLTPTPTVPPGPYARINGIDIEGGNYVVAYETFEFTEQLPGMHVHFFYDTVPPEEAGVPGAGPWILYGGPRPFREYTVASRPAAAEQMCILVANPDHSVIPNTGNCFDLPES